MHFTRKGNPKVDYAQCSLPLGKSPLNVVSEEMGAALLYLLTSKAIEARDNTKKEWARRTGARTISA